MHLGEITNFLDQRISELAKNRLPEEPVYPAGNSQYASFIMPKDEMDLHDKETDKQTKRSSSASRSNGNWSDDGKATNNTSVSGKDDRDHTVKRKTSEESSLSSDSVSKRNDMILPPFLSPTLPPQFIEDIPPIIPLPLSPTLPGAFQNDRPISKEGKESSPPPQKRKREDNTTNSLKDSTPKQRKSPPQAESNTPPSTKKSVSLNEYKKRKNANGANGPLTPTFQKTAHTDHFDSPRPTSADKFDSPSQSTTKPKEDSEAQKFTEKSQKYLAKGTKLKREADKLSRTDHISAAVTATNAILYFMSAFACDDRARQSRGKLPMHDNWKSTSEFIHWVINLQKDKNESELEGLCHQLHAVCNQRLLDNEIRFLRNSHKAFERQRTKEKEPIEPDEQFWRVWTESTILNTSIAKAWRLGQGKLSELVLREKFPQTWKNREYWGSERLGEDAGELGGKYRLPLGSGTSISEAVGFAQAVLREFVSSRGLSYTLLEL